MKQNYKNFLTGCIISLFTLSLFGQEKLFEFDISQNSVLDQMQEAKLIKIKASKVYADVHLVTITKNKST